MTATFPRPVPGRIVRGMPFSEYLADEGYGSSDLRTFRFGPPAMVPWRRAHREDGNTDATRIGKAAHCTILDPSTFDASFVIKPPGMEFRSNADKAKRDEWLASGREIITQSDADQIHGVVAAFNAKELARKSLDKAIGVEESIFWTGPYGLPCKCRPDWYDRTGVADLKVSVEATKSVGKIRQRAFDNGWLHQLAHNASGLRANGVMVKVGRLVVIAPEPPQHLRVWLLQVAENDMDLLTLENENTERDMVECHRSGVWPSTPEDWQRCPLPLDRMLVDDETEMEGATEVTNGTSNE